MDHAGQTDHASTEVVEGLAGKHLREQVRLPVRVFQDVAESFQGAFQLRLMELEKLALVSGVGGKEAVGVGPLEEAPCHEEDKGGAGLLLTTC